MSDSNHGSFPARYWEKLPDGRARCKVCPHHCVLKDGQRGLCFVRACENGQMVLTTYGRSSGFCMDPVEKKPLNHFLPGSAILSFGTAGCNLNCKFCQNWNISRSRQVETISEEASPEAIARAAVKAQCRSVAFTYNDPVVFMEYAVDTAKACHALGIKTVAVTAGFMCEESRAEFYRHMDAANVDLKAFTERFYRELCGARLQPVLDTLAHIRKNTSTWLEITTLLIPGENDSDSELKDLTRWIMENLGADTPLHFTAFHPDWKLTDHPSTPLATLIKARRIAMGQGLHFVYIGNVRDEEGAATCCPSCKRVVIGRDGYDITRWNLKAGGACVFCGSICAGVFEDQPGSWGGCRRPVNMEGT
ncbi:MAG: AmmeMemoRadiSam system radical SAM enzyme [Lentisphaerota bacterium]